MVNEKKNWGEETEANLVINDVKVIFVIKENALQIFAWILTWLLYCSAWVKTNLINKHL